MNALKIFENIYYSEPGCTDSRRTLDLYIPQNKGQGFPAFIYFHGGGLESGGKEDNAVIAKYLANKGIAFVSVNYRKYPDAKYPEFIKSSVSAAFSLAKEYFSAITAINRSTAFHKSKVASASPLFTLIANSSLLIFRPPLSPLVPQPVPVRERKILLLIIVN